DLDGDGRPDVVLTSLDAPPALLQNESTRKPVILELVGRSPKARVPFGARVRVTAGGGTLVRDLPGGGGYLSASEPRIYLGLGDVRRIERLEVAWPSGLTEVWRDLETSGIARVIEGEGTRK
ncbi:MAG: ASPIC/UnbV domain-containing protein, partial [Isosphaeraceae bacterium]